MIWILDRCVRNSVCAQTLENYAKIVDHCVPNFSHDLKTGPSNQVMINFQLFYDLNTTNQYLFHWYVIKDYLTTSQLLTFQIQCYLVRWMIFFGVFLGLNLLIFFVSYFCLQNKLFMSMAVVLVLVGSWVMHASNCM